MITVGYRYFKKVDIGHEIIHDKNYDDLILSSLEDNIYYDLILDLTNYTFKISFRFEDGHDGIHIQRNYHPDDHSLLSNIIPPQKTYCRYLCVPNGKKMVIFSNNITYDMVDFLSVKEFNLSSEISICEEGLKFSDNTVKFNVNDKKLINTIKKAVYDIHEKHEKLFGCVKLKIY